MGNHKNVNIVITTRVIIPKIISNTPPAIPGPKYNVIILLILFYYLCESRVENGA